MWNLLILVSGQNDFKVCIELRENCLTSASHSFKNRVDNISLKVNRQLINKSIIHSIQGSLNINQPFHDTVLMFIKCSL